ncbi:disease resistance protein RPP5-like [Morus notabilis]|uniref:disease resistance protein RPP5-like n=1 Tax=Morus notabilis TaxID=981085 RepID=UPI000CED776B|nr:disease resistance protein RPP5-like [Morus notabilis]
MEVEKNMTSFLNPNVQLDRFDGTNFTRWKGKLFFLSPCLKIAYVLDPKLEPLPEPKEDDSEELKTARKKRGDDEIMCRGHILNTLSDRLYDLYNSMESPVEIFESFQVGAIIAKLHQSWNGYRKKLLHRRDDITLEQLQKHLRIEEETKSCDSKNKNVDSSKVNVAEASKFSKNFKVNNDKKFKKAGNGQKKFSGNCFFCGKKGHRQNDCRYKKKKEEVNTNKANAVEEKSEDICAMNLGNLKRINLGYSKQLIKFPDQSRAPKLESINLEGCTNLVEVPPLNFQGCFGFLTLHGCIKIKSLPKISGNIKYLNLDETGIKELPLSIGRLESLVQLSLRGCQRIKNLSAASFLRNIQDLNLSDLSIKQVPSSIGSLENLVQLSLRGCQHIKHLPATLPRNLEGLYLIDSSIEQVSSSSIEGLDCLRIFNLSRCKKLESLPTNIFKCKSLQFLDLGDCSRFKKFTGIQVLSNSFIIEKFFGLRRQDMSWRKKLEFVPKWIYYLSCLKFLSRHGYLEPEHLQVKQFVLFSFNQLDLRNCNIVEIPVWLSLLSSLTILYLSGNPFENIPSSIIQLHRLNTLYIYGCKKLRSLPQLPSSVRDLNASGCTSLETISSSECYGFNIRHVIRPFISNHKRFTFQNCWKLGRNECRILTDFLYGVDKLNLLDLRNCNIVQIPVWLFLLSSLTMLDLSGNPFENIPSSIIQLDRLKGLDIHNCKKLRSLPQPPSSVRDLNASGWRKNSNNYAKWDLLFDCEKDWSWVGICVQMIDYVIEEEESAAIKNDSTIIYLEGKKANLNSEIREKVFSIFKD